AVPPSPSPSPPTPPAPFCSAGEGVGGFPWPWPGVEGGDMESSRSSYRPAGLSTSLSCRAGPVFRELRSACSLPPAGGILFIGGVFMASTVHGPDKEKDVPGSSAEDPSCRVQNVIPTGAVFSAALERLNRTSMIHVLQQIVHEVDVHCQTFGAKTTDDVNR